MAVFRLLTAVSIIQRISDTAAVNLSFSTSSKEEKTALGIDWTFLLVADNVGKEFISCAASRNLDLFLSCSTGHRRLDAAFPIFFHNLLHFFHLLLGLLLLSLLFWSCSFPFFNQKRLGREAPKDDEERKRQMNSCKLSLTDNEATAGSPATTMKTSLKKVSTVWRARITTLTQELL